MLGWKWPAVQNLVDDELGAEDDERGNAERSGALGAFPKLPARDEGHERSHRKEKVLLRETIGIKRFRTLQYWGTYLGYRQTGDLSPEMRQVFYYPPGSLAVQNGASGKDEKQASQKREL